MIFEGGGHGSWYGKVFIFLPIRWVKCFFLSFFAPVGEGFFFSLSLLKLPFQSWISGWVNFFIVVVSPHPYGVITFYERNNYVKNNKIEKKFEHKILYPAK